MFKHSAMTLLLLATVASVPAPAAAQAVGIGPRLTFVRGDVSTGIPSTRLFGGSLRMQTSKHMVLEAALDYRAEVSADRTSRFRERPLQGSLLLFPVRRAFAPYLLGGMGLYSQTLETLDVTGKSIASVTARKTGAHFGFGAEFFLGRHASFYADYRFRFVKFGTPEAGTPASTIPGSSLVPGLDSIKVSHQGSMWASGLAFYF